MSTLTLDLIKTELKKSVYQHYKSICSKYPEEHFYAYCLYTDDDVTSIGPVSNKTSEINNNDIEHLNYYKYCPEEWSDWDDYGLFDHVNTLIKNYYKEMEDNFEEYRESILKEALQILKEIDNEGLFGVKSDERFLVLWISDSNDKYIFLSAKELNTQKVCDEFNSEFLVD